jgi:putative ABC transport system permease protein
LQETSTQITKQEIVSSGENILSIINTQITLILVIAFIVEISLVYSLMKYVYSNNISSIRIFKSLGYSFMELKKKHFAFNNLIIILTIFITYLLSVFAVRIFLDKIMYTFINYVEVSKNYHFIILTNIMIFSIYLIFYKITKNKIKLVNC